MLKTKFSKLITLTSALVLLSFLGWYSISIFEDNKKEYYLEVQSKLLEAKYKTSYKNYQVMTSDIFSMYAKNKKLIELFSQAQDANETTKAEIRNKMYNLLSKNYKRLNNMGISQVHFYLPSDISFLRMYKPAKFGDDISATKPSVVLTNKLKLPHESFETCQFISGFRFLYPIQNSDQEHIGSVEIAYEGKQLLQSITDDFVYDAHILVFKDIVDNSISDVKFKKNYKDTWESKDYYLDTYVHKSIGEINLYKYINTEELQKKIETKIKTEKSFSLATKYNYQNIILTFLPIASVNKKNVSYIVTYTESDYLSNVKYQEEYIKTLSFVVLLLLYFFSIYVIFSQEKLKVLALYDTLTKLPNRTLFTIEFQNEINRAQRYESKLALMFLDLDGFKAVNDTYGHNIGDKLLQKVAKIISYHIRKSDIAARTGGDEFLILLSDVHKQEIALEIAQNIVNKLHEPILIEKNLLISGRV